MHRNEMETTKRLLQSLKRFDYSIFQFSDFRTSVNSSLSTLMEARGRHLIHVASSVARVISISSNVCEDVWKQQEAEKELPVDNDGVVFTCLKTLFECG